MLEIINTVATVVSSGATVALAILGYKGVKFFKKKDKPKVHDFISFVDTPLPNNTATNVQLIFVGEREYGEKIKHNGYKREKLYEEITTEEDFLKGLLGHLTCDMGNDFTIRNPIKPYDKCNMLWELPKKKETPISEKYPPYYW